MSWFVRMILIAMPAVLIAYGFVSWRVASALANVTRWPRAAIKWTTIAVVGYLNLFPILLAVGGLLQLSGFTDAIRGGWRWVDAALMFPFWIGLIIVVELLPWLLVMDFARLPLLPLFRKFRPAWLRWQSRITVALLGVAILYVPLRILNDTNSVRLRDHTVVIQDLAEDLDGLRIVQLSDLQADGYTDTKKMQKYIDLANAQNPDLIVFAGDLVTRGTDHIAAGAQMMAKLKARLGVYACLGDHDYWADAGQVTQQLTGAGVATLEDTMVTISASESKIQLAIVTNVYSRRPALQALRSLERRSREHAAVRILLSHQPSDEMIRFAQRNHFDMLLAGHTHGGQIVFRPFGIPFCVSHFETPYHSGFYQLGDLLLSVTNGLGLTLVPIRYQAPAEVTLLILRRP